MTTTKSNKQLKYKAACAAIDAYLAARLATKRLPHSATVAESNAAGDRERYAFLAAADAIREHDLAGVEPGPDGVRRLPPGVGVGVQHRGNLYIPQRGDWNADLPETYKDKGFKSFLIIPLDAYDEFDQQED